MKSAPESSTQASTFRIPARALIATVLLGAACPSPASALEYPGILPGPAQVAAATGAISFSNRALSASWTLTDRGLERCAFRDAQGGSSLVLTGDVFQIVLADGTRYRASALRRQGAPAIQELPARPNAVRLAERRGGRKVELPVTSTDGRLRVTWRVFAHDGANYVRQEIEITPLRENLRLSEILWLNQPIPEATPAGSVDGSPVIAGPFFLGCEDPMARNKVIAPEQEAGAWSPADLAAGERRLKRWPLSARLLHRGTNSFVFRYQRGPHRLDIWRMAMLEDGREIASDAHHGFAGMPDSDNTYLLEIRQLKPSAKYELAAQLSTDPGFKLPAGRAVESWGRVCHQGAGGEVVCRLPRNAVLRQGQSLTQSFVVGVAPPGQRRRAFLYYLERERAHPYRPFLHYNSWYDIAWAPFALNETNCLEAIRLFGERFIQPYGVGMDAMVFDDGWDDPRTLWQFHSGLPNGFTPLTGLSEQYHTRLGVWLSPFGGYGKPREQRLKFGREQGYETNASGFSLSGPRYYAAFRQACREMIRKYGVNHFKFDGIAAGVAASGGGGYVLDTEAMRRLMLELRQDEPNLYINLTTGSWPSPFWLRYADSVWRQGDDMGFAGKGPKQQQWLTYRDQETFRNIVRRGPLYPLNSLMTQGVAYSRQGMAGDPTFTSAGFKDDVRAFFGSGTGLQELYIQPGKLTAEDWKVLAEAAKWSRSNADVLVDTHWIGGDPSKLEVCGYASWSPRKGIVMLRNPDDQPHSFAFEPGAAFELPPGAPLKYSLRSPWAEDAPKPALAAEIGKPLRLLLQPFEVVVLDANPVP